MKDFDGFSPAVEISPYIWSVNGPDLLEHAIACKFVNSGGLRPCTCDGTREEYSTWYYQWLQWARDRVDTAPVDMPVEWRTDVVIGIVGHGPEEP